MAKATLILKYKSHMGIHKYSVEMKGELRFSAFSVRFEKKNNFYF